ncbi:MAG: hypothetical protein RIA72_10540 [Sphingopyxis sp.]|uniref:hypothetical protein n=1 Tax=Sphingopyxis sp. TaxID=1908224 RepID=UPI0032EC3E28
MSTILRSPEKTRTALAMLAIPLGIATMDLLVSGSLQVSRFLPFGVSTSFVPTVGLALPAIKRHNVHLANRLFFLLRCTVTRDPGHLPKGLLAVTNCAGKSMIAGTREAAEVHRGEPFTFEEIHTHQQSRIGTGERRDPKEAYSHAYTRIGKVFAKDFVRNPTGESSIIAEQAWGPIGWRLGYVL